MKKTTTGPKKSNTNTSTYSDSVTCNADKVIKLSVKIQLLFTHYTCTFLRDFLTQPFRVKKCIFAKYFIKNVNKMSHTI